MCGCPGLRVGTGINYNRQKGSQLGDENILKLDYADWCEQSKFTKNHWILYLKMGEFYGLNYMPVKLFLKIRWSIHTHQEMLLPVKKTTTQWSNHIWVLNLLSMDHWEWDEYQPYPWGLTLPFSPLPNTLLVWEHQSLKSLESNATLIANGIKNDHKHALHPRRIYTLPKRKAKLLFWHDHRDPSLLFRHHFGNSHLIPFFSMKLWGTQKQSIRQT